MRDSECAPRDPVAAWATCNRGCTARPLPRAIGPAPRKTLRPARPPSTTPLRALQLHPPYFHNGVAPTLEAVVELYNTKKGLNLTAQQKADLVQYLKSL